MWVVRLSLFISLSTLALSTLALGGWSCAAGAQGLPDPPDLTDPVEASLAIAQLTCEKAHACREDYPYSTAFPFELGFGDTVEACLRDHTKTRADLDWMAPAIGEGRLNYYPDRAERCWLALFQSDCQLFWMDQGGADCDTMVEGLVADGQACQDDLECIGSRCDPISRLCRSRD